MTSKHSPFDDRLFYKEAMSLHNAGYDVNVIGPWGTPPPPTQGVEFFGYTIRPWMRRLRLGWLCKLLQVVRLGFRIDADVHHCQWADMMPSALMLRWCQRIFRRKRTFVIHEIRDFYLREAYLDRELGLRDRVNLVLREKWDCFLQHRCDHIIGTEESKVTISRAYGIPDDRIVVIPHYVRLELFPPQTKTFDRHDFVVAYAGGLSFHRGIDKLAEACVAVAKKRGVRLTLLLLGKWHKAEEGRKFAQFCEDRRQWLNVQSHGWIPHVEVAAMLGRADVCCTVFFSKRYERVESGKEPPIKVYEYMACAKPIIASDLPALRYNLEKGRCGLLVSVAGGAAAIADAIEFYYDHPQRMLEDGANGRHAVEQWFCWPIGEKKLLNVYAGLLARRGRVQARESGDL